MRLAFAGTEDAKLVMSVKPTKNMKSLFLTVKEARANLSGRAPLFLMWILGVPLPIILLIWLFHG